MKTAVTLVFVSGMLMLLSSCEKGISFNLDPASAKLVVDASIENNKPPIVALSKSLDYFSEINPQILTNSFVKDAEVFISNGTLTHRLKGYQVNLGNGYYYYYYSIDSSSLQTAFTGELNKQYFLKIISDGKEYEASTTIPFITKKIDSVFWKQAPGSNDPDKVAVMVRVTDPAGYGDYVRYFTQRNSEPLYPAINSVFDDQIIDGTSYEVEVERGIPRNGDLPDGYTFFNKGDTVTLKLCNIDKTTFDFWRTMEFSYASVGNPFSSPTKVLGNISNGALGYFGGYAAQFRTIIIPK